MGFSSEMKREAARRIKLVPPMVALVYFVASSAWIVGSDSLVGRIAGSVEHVRQLQTYKGEAFVAASALAIFFMLHLALRRVSRALKEAAASESRLQMALCSAGGGAWELDLRDGRGVFAFMSPALLDRLGLPPDHAFSLEEFRAMRHPDDADRVEDLLREAISTPARKPFDAQYRLRGKDGRDTWVHSRGAAFADEAGKPSRFLGIALDVTEKVEAEQRIHHLTNFDSHTGLLKPAAFYAAVDRRFADEGGRELAVLQLKLSGATNLIGDGETLETSQLMRRLARRLQRLPSRSFIASLLAPDVMAVATAPAVDGDSVERLCQRVVDLVSRPMQIGGKNLSLDVEAGAAVLPRHGSTAAQVCRRAGMALNARSAPAHAPVSWFREELDAAARLASQRAQDLAEAIAAGQIECRFQPLVNIQTGEIAGFEALARWQRPGEGMVPPSDFIRLAEERGLIGKIGEKVLQAACAAAAGWSPRGGQAPFVAVNVSPHQLADPEFPRIVEQVLADTGLPPQRLELELTESALAGDVDAAAIVLGKLRRIGVQLAIDDFGTGYSSLSLLTRLPFTRLKIDRSFVQACETSTEAEHVVRAIAGLARHLGMETTVEGIETPSQARRFDAEGIDLAQGYLFGKAVTADTAAILLGGAKRQSPGFVAPPAGRKTRSRRVAAGV